VNQCAHAIGVPPDRTCAVANGTRSVTVEVDLRFSRFFSLPEGHFLRLQNAFDMLEAKQRSVRGIEEVKLKSQNGIGFGPDFESVLLGAALIRCGSLRCLQMLLLNSR
jgi:addiction module HigA family antidote